MIRVGIAGFGNIGRGVEAAVTAAADMTLAGVFTRREPKSIVTASGARVYSYGEAAEHAQEVDVMVMCGGSKSDLPAQTPQFAKYFNVVDSFDTHANIPAHFAAVDAAARMGERTAVISAGWDPGLFSIARVYGEAALPQGESYTFWGRGVSQGHSDAVRRIEGVADARQYTIPSQEAMAAVRAGKRPVLTVRDRHTRLVYVVAKPGADKEGIQKQIVGMENYFDEYDTTVVFITAEEMAREHSALPHGGFVMRSGDTRSGEHLVEYSLKLASNPEFTGGVLAACARAAVRLNAEGRTGAFTMPEIAPCYLLPIDRAELLSRLI